MIKFIKIRDEKNKFDDTNVVMTMPDGDLGLEEVIETFNRFLTACGYGSEVEIKDDNDTLD